MAATLARPAKSGALAHGAAGLQTTARYRLDVAGRQCEGLVESAAIRSEAAP